MAQFTDHPKPSASRIGFHYYSDSLHYRSEDIHHWMPILKKLRASWLVLQSDHARAIPQSFIQPLLDAGITPIVQFDLDMNQPPNLDQVTLILQSYANWGVKYVQFFDRPNSNESWQSDAWLQEDLVDHFLNLYIPFANQALALRLLPLFPALEPGGSYWDTAFLRLSLERLKQRNEQLILDNLILTAFAWTFGHHLNWGIGGPERWPGARPYHTPETEQDQLGFRTYDWYNTICEAVLQRSVPVILLGAGVLDDPESSNPNLLSPQEHQKLVIEIASSLLRDPDQQPATEYAQIQAIPSYVLATCFFTLAATTDSCYAPFAWHLDNAPPNVTVEAFTQWINEQEVSIPKPQTPVKPAVDNNKTSIGTTIPQQQTYIRPIRHYLLLPTYEWGIADWHLEVIQPFVKKYRPTIGFSIEEAQYAQYVTIIGNQQTFSEEDIAFLENAGCTVKRITGDGTTIATQLAQR